MNLSRVGGVAAAVGVLLCCGSVLAQQSTGADVIVGDLPGISNNAASGLYDSLAVGTTSCNKGSMPLNWFTGNTDNRHPVIGQNLFRLRGGKFEQIGQGWLKHGFTALQGNICQAQFGFNCSPTAGTTLGVGCSDPYNSGLNNVNGNGGPKWQVNAATGLFPYPFSATGSAPVRVRVTDIAQGDRYFIEGQYVCGDDAQVNGGANKFNNASWEEVTVAGACCSTTNTCSATTQKGCTAGTWLGGQSCTPNPCGAATGACCLGASCSTTSQAACTGLWTGAATCPTLPCPTTRNFDFTIAGSTVREQPAIYAWRSVDATVTISTFDVPDDGRFILACKVTGPVSGQYTYEYALHNLNSHRCAGSFIVPMPGSQGALGNIGFHDAESVNEPNALATPTNPSGDDWTASGTGSGSTSVAWAGAAYSGAPPRYVLSTTSYMLAPISTTSPNPATDGFTAGTGNDHSANVARWGNLFNFRLTCAAAPASGSVAVGLWRPGTGSSIVMAATTPGGATTGTLTAACCNGGSCTVVSQSACGSGTWGLPGSACTPNPCAQGSCCVPASGACSMTTLSGCASGSNWTTGGTCSPNTCPVVTGACCAPSGCSPTTQSACSGTFMGVGTACGTVTCPSGNDACAGATALCASQGVAGSTASATFSASDFNLGASVCGQAGASPDVWFSYVPATGGSITIDTCTASYDTVLSANTGACGVLTQVQCNDDAGTAAPPAGCGGGNNLHSRVTFTAAAGTRYLLRVAGFQGLTGTFTITATGGGGTGCNGAGSCCAGASCSSTTSTTCAGTFTAGGSCNPNPCNPSGACCTSGNCTAVQSTGCVNGVFTAGGSCTPNPCPPLSDACANRQGIPAGATPFDTTNATTDGPIHALCANSGDSNVGKDVWYNFPCTFDGTIDIDTCGSAFDTKVAVYSGTGCTSFESRILACNDDSNCASGTLQSKILALPVVCGEHYTIRVGGFTSAGGTVAAGPGTLTITPHPAPLGACCAADGSCAQSQQGCCVGSFVASGACTPNPCPQPSGACCSSGSCTIQTHAVCGGTDYQGDNSSCTPNPCPQTSGACCNGTACAVAIQSACSGAFQGAGSACGTTANPTTCCKANFNQVGGIAVNDIFDYLAAFFAQGAGADFNGDGAVGVQDIFDFLAAWFVGC